MTELAIAFDVDTIEEALALDRALGPGPEIAKVGLQLFSSAGPRAVEALRARGRSVFLDLKLHDIPNTVRGAAVAASRLGCDFLTVHASGGEEMVRAAAEGIDSISGSTRVIAVTVLTSIDPKNPPPGTSRPFALEEVQAQMLAMAERAGAKGIVCSAADLKALRSRHPQAFYAVTPGIRPSGAPAQDQRRVATVAAATGAGSSLIVLGRAVTAAPVPRLALEAARAERDAALELLGAGEPI